MLDISLQNIYKSYEQDKMVVKDISLEIFEGEFLVFVGPSGCGKTTTLRMIAGLEEITSGKLFINDVLQNDLDPSTRNLSFVFQNYALLPNLSVYDNIEFGLLHLKLDKLTKKKMVEDVARKLGIYEKLGSYISNLSGGQRQRVALARALVDEKKLILFDEPLSNLDAVLRSGMRKELILFKNKFGVTSIYVTHDQIEAMTMATRIVFLMDGKIVQVGSADQLYNDPNNVLTAEFIGSPEINLIEGLFDGMSLLSETYKINLPKLDLTPLASYKNQRIILGIRPEQVKLDTYDKDKSELNGQVMFVEQLGDSAIVYLNFYGKTIKAVTKAKIKIDETYSISFNKVLLFDASGKRIKEEQITHVYFNNFEPPHKIMREIRNYGYELVYQKSDNEKTFIEVGQMHAGYEIKKQHNKPIIINQLSELFKYITYQK